MLRVETMDDPVSIHSFQVLTEASVDSLHHNRKRKCQGEHQEWPTSKHKCFALASSSSSSDAQTQNMESISEAESFNDSSNSLPAQSESVTSSYVQIKSDSESSKNHAYGQLEDHLLEFEMHGNNEEESECEIDTMELGEKEDKDFEDLLLDSDCSKVNPNKFVFTSGGWVVKQDDPRSAARKPTIDQEFEQYFSTLML